MRGLAALLLLLPAAVSAEVPIVVSAAPDDIGVTIYRYNFRSADSFVSEWENGWQDYDDNELPQGFAMIDEVRTVDLPPGQVTVRFEGVASGIVPQSAILFDNDLSEKNFDARLLSERGLLDAFTGQSVTIRRTDPATGTVRTEQGTIMSYPELILHTSAGYEAIRCEGNHSSLLFPGVPVDLTARPTLSMTTRPDQPGGKLTLHLAYLAANFDWNATYVGTFSPDAGTLRLAGWLTLESADQTSFADANTSAVAGTVFRAYPTDEEQEAEEEAREDDPYAPDNIEIAASCWPGGRTSGANQFLPDNLGAPIELSLNRLPQFTVSQGFGGGGEDEAIMVTGSRIIRPSTIGDLKFYRLPHRTTVAAQSQKQVRFLDEQEVRGETLFVAEVRNEYADDGELVFRFKNEKRNGLGVPLPLGGMTLFQETRLGRQLVGPAAIGDKAIGEDVEIAVARDASDEGVDIDVDEVDDPRVTKDDQSRQEVTVENWNEYPVTVEVELYDTDEYRIGNLSEHTFKRDGARVWRVVLKPEEERKMRFTSTEVPEPDWDY